MVKILNKSTLFPISQSIYVMSIIQALSFSVMETHIRWFLCGILYNGLKKEWLTSTARQEISPMQRVVIDHLFDELFTLIIRGTYSQDHFSKFIEDLNALTNVITVASQSM